MSDGAFQPLVWQHQQMNAFGCTNPKHGGKIVAFPLENVWQCLKRAAPVRAQSPCTKEYTNLSSRTHCVNVSNAKLGKDVCFVTYVL